LKFTLKETYLIFRALLYVNLRLAGRAELVDKIIKEYPEWQKVIDRKIKDDAVVEVFRKRVLG